MIKEWLNDADVCYTEGPISLNWSAILAQIRSDISGFIKGNGWSFLMDNPGDQSSESEVGTDENYDEQEELK